MIDQKKALHARNILNKFQECIINDSSEIDFAKVYADEIILSLKKFDDPDPIEVNIQHIIFPDDFYKIDFPVLGFGSEERAREWCELKGLKVKR